MPHAAATTTQRSRVLMDRLFAAVRRSAVWIVLAAVAGAALCLDYAVGHLRINTDTANMLDAGLPFRQSLDKFRREFAFNFDSLLLVIDAPGPEDADRAATALASALETRDDLFEDVFVPGAGAYFERNALLYLSVDELESLADRLIRVQPLLGRLTRDPSVVTFADTLSLALERDDVALAAELPAVLEELRRSFNGAMNGGRRTISWQRLLGPGDEPQAARRYLHLKLRLDFSDLLAAEPAIRAIRDAAAAQGLTGARGFRVRITGDAALAYEELLSAVRGAKIAGALALIMVTGVLLAGLGSVWLVIAALITLIVGLLMTAGFATVAVGHLNLISIAFAVLYIGLGVDYAIHICLRYRELLGRGESKARAIGGALNSVGGSLMACTVTTAAAFYAFLPTVFSGVAELGLISGTGMFINLAMSLLVLPALLWLLPPPKPWRPGPATGSFARLLDFPRRRRNVVGAATLLLALASVALLPQVRFDRNTLNLRDPGSESVTTARELMADRETSPLGIDVLVDDSPEWPERLAALRALPAVDSVVSLADFVPESDPEKLRILDELALTFGPDLRMQPATPAPDIDASLEALERLRDALARADRDRGLEAPAQALSLQIGRFLEELRGTAPRRQQQRLMELRHDLLSNLPFSLERLSRALEPDASAAPDPSDGLPAELRRRWVSDDGVRRVNIRPARDLDDPDALRGFVESVQSVVPEATGEPVIMLRAGDAVVQAFQQAFAWALFLISGLLLALLRNLAAVLYVIGPLFLAGAMSLAGLALLDAPLNFANVIALPLLLGIGVDNGIHMVQRARHGHHPEENPLRTSTARAVLFSALTTMCGFGNLVLSPHPGTASMGLLLTLGTVITLGVTLIVLPALLAARPL